MQQRREATFSCVYHSYSSTAQLKNPCYCFHHQPKGRTAWSTQDKPREHLDVDSRRREKRRSGHIIVATNLPVNDEEEKDETARPAMKEEVRPQRAEEEEEDPELEAESRTRDVELDEAPSDKAPMEVQSAIAISHSSNSNKRECVCSVRERQRERAKEKKRIRCFRFVRKNLRLRQSVL